MIVNKTEADICLKVTVSSSTQIQRGTLQEDVSREIPSQFGGN